MSVAAAEDRENPPGSSAGKTLAEAGRQLRRVREERGLTLKDVEEFSAKLAQRKKNPSFLISAGRLSQMETRGSLPSLYKLATLSEAYRISCLDLLRMYGIKVRG